MRTPVLVGQVNVHVDGRHGGLMAFPLVPDGDGVFKVLDTDTINGNVAMVALILNILHLYLLQRTPLVKKKWD